ncbi:MAG: hypothetical protein Q9227_008924 [Pyrenula ochraceoflavens]
MNSTGSTPHIVCLETCHCDMPAFSFPHKWTSYYQTTPASPEVSSRLQTADIAITTVVPITPADLDACPNLKLVAVMATGMEWVDKQACKERGVMVINCPGSNIPAVSEHALAFYFAARKRIVELTNITRTTDLWIEKGTLRSRFTEGFPLGCAGECVGIIGYGMLGKRIETLMQAVGMGEVLIADRKGVAESDKRPGRTSFEEVLRRASVLVICCPRDPSTLDLIDEAELRLMRKEAIVINVARGGIVNEDALAKALKETWIASAATDVLTIEPGGRSTSPLLADDVPNLTVTPHLAWYAEQTLIRLQQLLKDGMEAYMAGHPIHVQVDNRELQ